MMGKGDGEEEKQRGGEMEKCRDTTAEMSSYKMDGRRYGVVARYSIGKMETDTHCVGVMDADRLEEQT